MKDATRNKVIGTSALLAAFILTGVFVTTETFARKRRGAITESMLDAATKQYLAQLRAEVAAGPITKDSIEGVKQWVGSKNATVTYSYLRGEGASPGQAVAIAEHLDACDKTLPDHVKSVVTKLPSVFLMFLTMSLNVGDPFDPKNVAAYALLTIGLGDDGIEDVEIDVVCARPENDASGSHIKYSGSALVLYTLGFAAANKAQGKYGADTTWIVGLETLNRELEGFYQRFGFVRNDGSTSTVFSDTDKAELKESFDERERLGRIPMKIDKTAITTVTAAAKMRELLK